LLQNFELQPINFQKSGFLGFLKNKPDLIGFSILLVRNPDWSRESKTGLAPKPTRERKPAIWSVFNRFSIQNSNTKIWWIKNGKLTSLTSYPTAFCLLLGFLDFIFSSNFFKFQIFLTQMTGFCELVLNFIIFIFQKTGLDGF
jgi:hypothetical protein